MINHQINVVEHAEHVHCAQVMNDTMNLRINE